MGLAIRLKIGDLEFTGRLNDTPSARETAVALPVSGTAHRWGGEYYMTVGVQAPLEADASDLLQVGDLGYWPGGQGLCLFWGPTPASRGDEIRGAEPVNVIGSVRGDFEALSGLGPAETMTLETE